MGDRVTVAPGVSFVTHDGSTWLFRDAHGRRFRYARIHVGSDVFIGVNAIIMPGVRLGNRVIVGAGSIVTKSVPDGMIVAGSPAKIVGDYADLERRVLETFPAARAMIGLTWRERVDSIVEKEFRPELTK